MASPSSFAQDFFGNQAFEPGADSELPSYTHSQSRPSSVQRERTEYEVELRNGKNKPWAVLKLVSYAPARLGTPVFLERHGIVGSLKLRLEKEDPIQAITLMVTGKAISGLTEDDILNFWEHSQILWSTRERHENLTRTLLGRSQCEKLVGEHTWPFNIPFPKEVCPTGEHGSCRLPESFVERHTRGSIGYIITVHISRPKLRSDSRLFTKFAYIPFAQPGPPSELRQAAYEVNVPIPSPMEDPDGWKTFNTVSVRGTIFNSREVEARCTLSIAAPLCYTRGTAIPCYLRIESDDAHALDLLSVPKAVAVKLRRVIRYRAKTEGLIQVDEGNDHCYSAYWWPSSKDLATHSKARELPGEIRLEKSLKLSTSIPLFHITYYVALYPFEAAGFQTVNTQPLLDEPVEIVSGYAPGPLARVFSPPKYDIIPKPYNDNRYGEHLGGTVPPEAVAA